MTDFLKVLLNIRSLRAVARDLTLEQLEEGLAKLTSVVEERRANEAEDRKSREERERKISEYMNMLRAGRCSLYVLGAIYTCSKFAGLRCPLWIPTVFLSCFAPLPN